MQVPPKTRARETDESRVSVFVSGCDEALRRHCEDTCTLDLELILSPIRSHFFSSVGFSDDMSIWDIAGAAAPRTENGHRVSDKAR